MKISILLMFFWGLSCALPVARYQNNESESSEEWKDHLGQAPTPPLESNESSEGRKVSSEEQANEDPSDSAESEEGLGSDDRQYIYRPTGGFSRSTGEEGYDKDDEEDDSGDDTFGDDDNGPRPKDRQEGGNSRLGSDEDSADTTQSSEEGAPQGQDSAQDTTSESRDLDNEDQVDSRPEGGDSTQESESEEHWVGGGSEGESSHGDGSEFDDEGMQSDDPDSIRSERGNSRMNSAGMKSKESRENSGQANIQDSGDSQLVEHPSKKIFRKSRISEEDDKGELDDNNTMEEVKSDSTENSNSREAGLSQPRRDSKGDSQEDSKENPSQEDSQNLDGPSSESSQEADLPSQESSSESREEVVSESRGDNPDPTTSYVEDQEDSDSSEEDSSHTLSHSESESKEEQADSESSESLNSSEESPESPEDENSSSQEGLQSHSASAESQSEESQSDEDDSDSQDSSRSKEDSNSTESKSSSEEDGQLKNIEIESRKLTVDAYHNKPIGDQDDNDCQDGY
ncbi:dentin matrix acidic phosphoprotein 1 isoform X1 [Cebus imitator]|uniref:Dentin matrix acidic phosphoprotein 1 n=1 Tax=Cebus imitator TaxID=2715852 RepID=A0A2K5PWD0_CEBIM|nr:dentin matrix acidic phosphoprotein 1 isoform X1 [Cebus imitator]XP_037600426.1 dentin matrix acidic phosphoprotein 1 isoform X1 [Cebus imitator]